MLADALAKANRTAEAAQAYATYVELSLPELQRLERAARGDTGQLPSAERDLREWLNGHPTDVVALQLLGNVYLRQHRHEEAEEQLSKALRRAPGFTDARWLLAGTFVYRGHWKRALAEAEKLLDDDPDKSEYLDVKAYSLL